MQIKTTGTIKNLKLISILKKVKATIKAIMKITRIMIKTAKTARTIVNKDQDNDKDLDKKYNRAVYI